MISQSSVFVHTADSCTLLTMTIVNTHRFTAGTQDSHLHATTLLMCRLMLHKQATENWTRKKKTITKKLKLPHGYDEYRKEPLAPKILRAGQTLCMSQNIAKTKFQIQNHQTKIWPHDIPQRLSRSVEEFWAAEPRPQSADETPKWTGQKAKHESLSSALNFTKKAVATPLNRFTIVVAYQSPATLSGTGSRGNF